MNFLNQLYDFFIPSNLDAIELTRAKVLVSILMLCNVFSIVLLGLSFFVPTDFPYVFLIGIVLILLSLYKFTKSNFWVGNVFAGILFVVMAMMSRNTGGIYSIDLVGIVLVPIIALTINGFASAFFWLVLSVALNFFTYFKMIQDPAVATLHRLQTQDFSIEYYLIFNMILLLLPISCLAVIERLNKSLINNLKEANENLDVSKNILEKQTLDLVKAKQDLEKSNSLLEKYAFSASHDLKQPIRSIISFTELFKRKFDTYNIKDEKLESYMGLIISGTHRMNDQIQEFLDFSRSSENENAEWVDLNEVLEHVLIDIEKLRSDKSGEVQCGNLPRLKVAKTTIAQLFQNLISNAIKYQSPKRPLNVTIAAEEKEREWLFSIKDNGIGINPDDKELIFKSRTQLNAKAEGKGIGLSTCKDIIEKYQGKIWVDSELDNGSTFYFTLPKTEVD